MKTYRMSLAQRLRLWVGVGVVGLSLASGAQAQTEIKAVTGSIQGGAEVVKIDLSQPLTAVPTGFAIQSPAKIALDFPGVVNGIGRSNVEINQGNLRSVSVIQAGNRSRVVLNLKQPTNYKAHLNGNSLMVVLDPPVASAAASAPVQNFAEGKNRDVLPLKDIDFRRGVDETGRVIVTLPNNQVGVDIRQHGQSLIVEFMKSSLPEGLRRKFDVTDFGTPVQTVTSFQTGDRVRMVIEPRGLWEHSAYQSDEQFVVEVRPVKVDPNKLTQGAGYNGQKLSLNFQNIEIRALLQVIADFTNFNVVTSDAVSGTVTLRLQDVPWDQALDIILQSKGLGVRKTGNVLWIAPKEEIIAREKLERESNVALENLEPVQTQSFLLNYAKAEVVAKGLMGDGAGGGGGAGSAKAARILSTRGSVIFETRTNQLFVTDTTSKLEQVKELISKIDVPVRQVMIEARIVEATDNFGKALGVKLGGAMQDTMATPLAGGSVNPTYNFGSAGTTPGNFVNLPAPYLGTGYNAGTFALSIFSSGAQRFLNLELSALESDRKGKVVSSPRVVTADKVKALIEQGEELPYQQASASGATSISFRKANLKLEVTPQITPEGGIILELDISKDTVGRNTTAGFAIDTKHVKTEVLVENGGTVVIGGIFEMVEREQINKIPFFGDLPIIGVLFRAKETIQNKQELLIFITPRTLADKAQAVR